MILAIESSCDDSSIAIIDIQTKMILFHKKVSQESQHNVYGGVVPELASRLHLEALPKLLLAVKEFLPSLKAIAVTNEPGLNVTLMEGVMMAKALSITLNLPLIGVNHLKGHIYSLFINKELDLPQTVILLSGGHTMILEVADYYTIKTVATTSDDSFGESFDKVAKMLGLGYPGGPIIEQYANEGDENRFDFPIPLAKSPRLEFSYSGLKNAVRLAIENLHEISQQDKQDIAASFQKVAIAHIMQKTKKYFKTNPPKSLAIVGGASANLRLRESLTTLTSELNIPFLVADLQYTSDNAAMIARAAIDKYNKNDFSSVESLTTRSRVEL